MFRRCSGIFIFNFEHISHFLSRISIADFEQVFVFWMGKYLSKSTIKTLTKRASSNIHGWILVS